MTFRANTIDDVYELSDTLQDDAMVDYFKKLAVQGDEDFVLTNTETNEPTAYLKTNDGKLVLLGRVKKNINPREKAITEQTESVEPQTSKGLMARSKAIGSEFAPLYTEENIGDMFVDVAKFGLDNFAAALKGSTQAAIGFPGDIPEIYKLIQDGVSSLYKLSEDESEDYKEVMKNFGKGMFYLMGLDPNNVWKILEAAPSTMQVKEFFDSQNWSSLMQKDNPFEGLGEVFLDFLMTKKVTPKIKGVESIDDAQKTLQSMQKKPVKGKRNARR